MSEGRMSKRETDREREREWGTWARESGVEFEANLLRAG